MFSLFELLLAGIPQAHASAPDINAVIQLVAGPLTGIGAPTEFGGIAQYISQNFLPFVNVIAVVTIVVSGLLSVIAQDENRIQATRKVVSGVLTAIVLINASAAIAIAVTDEFNYMNGAGPGGGSGLFSAEVFGLLSWIEQPVMVLALLTIVITGIRAVMSFGSDDGLAKLRSTFIAVIFGVILIVVKIVVAQVIVVERQPEQLTEIGINLVGNIILYMGLIAVVMIAIAGMYMIVNIGNDEQYTKAKNLIGRVVIGLVVIAVAAILAVLVGDALLTG